MVNPYISVINQFRIKHTAFSWCCRSNSVRIIPSLALWSIVPCPSAPGASFLVCCCCSARTPTPHPHGRMSRPMVGLDGALLGAPVAQGCWDCPMASQASTDSVTVPTCPSRGADEREGLPRMSLGTCFGTETPRHRDFKENPSSAEEFCL